MLLLLDTDAFCKFAAAELLSEAASAVGADLAQCRRLPALPHMLRRGRLRRALGDTVSDSLIPVAEGIEAAPAATEAWLDPLVGVRDIDPGEAQLLAFGAEHEAVVLTGDKRSLLAARNVPALVGPLRGKIALPEVVFHRLCETLGDQKIHSAVLATSPSDVMLKVCFSKGNRSPRQSLESYIADSRRTLAPLELWTPPPRTSE